ncbi:hypothetical protein FKP32DRAFT_1609249 [Trametes sanguinea]|nr:hypothetical protein FKP32DRAFT_1609249 [Trametes sanguinea]
MKGHIIVHPQRPEKLLDVLPLPVEDIITPICIIFVGSKPPSKEWLQKKAKPLVVRREKILRALTWLKDNNELYKHMTISEDNLSQLPVDDLLPYAFEHVADGSATDSLTAGYDGRQPPAVSVNEGEGQLFVDRRDVERSRVVFDKVVITDVEGRAPAHLLRAAAIRHIKRKGGGYVEIPHMPEAANEFGNPALFPMIYPTLFPYGIGGFEDSRRIAPLSLKRHTYRVTEFQSEGSS